MTHPGAPTRTGRSVVCTRGWSLLVAVLVLLVVPLAGTAAAHADFVSADPGPGRGLPQAPGEVVIRFTEPLIEDLSSIEVVGPDGAPATDGATRPVQGDRQAMRRELGLLAPGTYTVRWTTVSPLDGHTRTGTYTFAIGGTATSQQDISTDPISSQGWLGLVGRWVALVGLVLWAGHALLSQRARRAGMDERWLARLGWAAPLLMAIGTLGLVAGTTLQSTGTLTSLPRFLAGSQTGRLRFVMLVAAAAGATAGAGRRWLSASLAGVALLAEAASGHAASNPWPALAVPAFAAHLAAVGVWVFAVTAALLGARDRLRQVLAAFAPYAIAAGVVVAATGVGVAALELTAPSDVLATIYGQVVGLKGTAFVVMAAAGAVHHLQRRRGRTGRALHRPLRVEAGAAMFALVAATVLVGFPDPPREAEATAGRARGQHYMDRVAAEPALSVADVSGPFVVAITLLPPEPGRVEVRLHVLGLEPGDGPRSPQMVATAPDGTEQRTALTDRCGSACWAGTVRLEPAGDWRLAASLTTNRDDIDIQASLPLPTPEATDTFQTTMTAMRQLDSARVTETLAEGEHSEPIISDYTFIAPDRMRWEASNGFARVAIGEQGYLRKNADAAWETYEWTDPGFSWPGSFYEAFWPDPSAVRRLGTETIDGTDTTVIGFVLPDYPAWFRLWIDDDQRVRRMQMLADAHIMVQDFRAYNDPLTVQAPIPGGTT